MARTMFRRPLQHRDCTHTAVFELLSNTAAKKRCKATIGPAQESHRQKQCRHPPDVIPMWGQMVNSGNCCGFIYQQGMIRTGVAKHASLQTQDERQTKAADQETPKWHVARHGSLLKNKEKMRIKDTDLAAHLTVHIHLCEARGAERRARSEAAKQYRRKRGIERRREKRKRKGQKLRSVMIAATPAAPQGPGQRSSGPSMAHLSALIRDDLPAASFLETSEVHASWSFLRGARRKRMRAKLPRSCGSRDDYSGAIKDTLEKTEAPKKRVKTVTMRADSLATTEADFFKTLLDHHEETQKHLNELSAQLCQVIRAVSPWTVQLTSQAVPSNREVQDRSTCGSEHECV